MNSSVLSLMGGLFEYPTASYFAQTDHLQTELETQNPLGAIMIKPFADFVHNSTLKELEESFSYTFDLNPVCTLEIGWHLFGEDYRRGQFMAKVREELAKAGLDESHELPDHLTHVMMLLDAMSPEDGEYFASSCVIPGMTKMLEGHFKIFSISLTFKLFLWYKSQ